MSNIGIELSILDRISKADEELPTLKLLGDIIGLYRSEEERSIHLILFYFRRICILWGFSPLEGLRGSREQ